MSTATALTSLSKPLHIIAGVLSFDDIYLTEKTPLLVRDRLVTFGDILPETSSAWFDMGGNPVCVYRHLAESDGTSLLTYEYLFTCS